MANGIVTAVRGRSGGSYGLVTGVRGRAVPQYTGVVTSVRGRAVDDAVTVDAGSPATVDPFEVADLAPTWVGSATSWVWTQTAGPSVVLVGTGSDRQYVTPGTRTGTAVTFRVTVSTALGSTATDTVTHTIRGHGGPWVYSGGVLVAVPVNPPTL